ncbi:inositol 1,4,5-trisphosphate receptor type 3-like [Elysia marginata]|uniref:Inositol 1,4,5-trisphosphate receptor type 3-like n=1 Tax=Elysia marginata TaxID=1093978 RepID=A0AAV4FJX2_9GAST|nr:inositol 1,4,5-trisphosphate receptor type 3-like [Elysia marginata]
MLLKPLISLVDGQNDKPFPNRFQGAEAEEVITYFQKTGRFQKSEETKAIVDAKIQALEVLNLFFNFIFNLRMEKFMNMFKLTHSQASVQNMPPPELFGLLNSNDDFDVEESGLLCRTALRKLGDIFTETDFFEKKELTDILLDLSSYDYDEMIRKSMFLLNRYYSAHKTLFQRAVQAQVLTTDESINVANRLDTLLPTLRRLATSKLNSDQTNELCAVIDQLIGMCHLKDEPEEHHSMNQSILYNFGVLEDCFTILSQDIDVKLLDQYGGLKKIFQKTFLLLKNMARSNKTVQTRLFDRVDLLLSKEGAPGELAEALTEIFTGNSNTCMKVGNHQVQKIMGLVAKHKTDVPQFLDLLNAIVKVEELDLPLKRNQGFVMTYFMQFRAEVADIIDDKENKSNRVKILEGSSSRDLNYLVALVDLLATCAEGENRYIESICQTIFSIPDMLEVLNNRKIINNFKRPYLRFFLWVYLNTAGGMIDSGAGDLPHDKVLWDFLEGLREDLIRMQQFAERNPDAVKLLLKQPPSTNNDGSTGDEEMRGTLHYFFDAVMPFFQVFCRSYYQPDELFPEEPARLANLTKAFEGFMDAIAPRVSIERQMKNLISAMTALITASNAISMSVKYSEVGGDEELPLGQEFQEHLKCFIDEKQTKPILRFARAEKLVQQLAISQQLPSLSEKETLEQQELDIKCLMLLRGLIHNEIVRLPEDWESDPKGHKKAFKKIEDVQNALDHYDVVDGTLGHLSRPQDDIVRELLAFLAVLLFSGNSNVQDSMYAFFTGTREETFFFAVKNRVHLSALATREKRLLHAMHQAKIDELVSQAKALRKAMQSGDANPAVCILGL